MKSTQEELEEAWKEIKALHDQIDKALYILMPLQSNPMPSVLKIREVCEVLSNASRRL